MYDAGWVFPSKLVTLSFFSNHSHSENPTQGRLEISRFTKPCGAIIRPFLGDLPALEG